MESFRIALGETCLITTDSWFYAPNGQNYRAVFGTLQFVDNSMNALGIKVNSRSADWFVTVGNQSPILIAGCQIHYCIKTNECHLGDVEYYVGDDTPPKLTSRQSSIFNANEIFIPTTTKGQV